MPNKHLLNLLQYVWLTLKTLCLITRAEYIFNTAQKIYFSIEDFFSKCDQIRNFLFTEDLVLYTKEILNGKLHFWCCLKSKVKKKQMNVLNICGALRDLVPFVQFEKREKHPCRSVTKINTPPWVLSTFLKLYKWYQIAQRITYAKLIINKNLNQIVMPKNCYKGLFLSYLP